jgi:glycosyltransferase involved in cell wall biosynthesis
LVRLVEKKLKKRSDSLGIHYPGKLNAQQLIENMLNADVFVHPSYIDNSPNSLCEAMMLGMPVIASYAGGIPSMVEPGQNGFLIQPGDPFVLASLLLILHKDPALASKIGENARKTALYRHNRDTIVNDLLTIYSKTIKHRSTDEPVRHYSDL